MANGYKPGDYLTQFLNQLPQIYQARQNSELQRERFEYMKEEGIKDDVYRGQVLTANQERNKLARDQFNQRTTQNDQDEAYRESVLKNATATQEYNEFNQQYAALAGNKEGQEMLLKSKFKDNQQMIDSIDENRDIKESMQGQVYALDALPPEQRLLQARKLLSSPHLTNDLYKTLTTITKGGKEELFFTQQELGQTTAGIEYATKLDQFENPDKYLPAGITGAQRNTFLTTIGNQLEAIKKEGLAEYKTGYGEYPTYDNVEDVDDNELDAYIAETTGESIDGIGFTTDSTGVGGINVQTAGGGLGFPTSDKTQAPSKKPLVVEDESGLEALVKEYEPRGSLGILEKAAKEGSVIKPVTGKMFKAISGGLSDLDSADGSMTGLTYPAVLASKPADFDQRYQKASTKFKKTLKDMYNLYLRLDPEKGAYQTKFTTGNRKMRSKIEKKLKIYKKRGQGSGSPYRFDEEIQSILDKIEF